MYIFHSGRVCGCRGSRPVTGKEEKNMKKAIAIVLLAVMILGLLAACGGSKDSGDKKFLGTYKFSKLGDMTVQEYADLIEMSLEEAQNFMTLELKSGGKGVFSTDDDPTDITWKVDGEKLVLTGTNDDGSVDSIEGTIKDGVIVLQFDDEVVELTK